MAVCRQIACTDTTLDAVTLSVFSGRAFKIVFPFFGVTFYVKIDHSPTQSAESMHLAERNCVCALLGLFAGRTKMTAPATFFVVGYAFAPRRRLLAFIETLRESHQSRRAAHIHLPGTSVAFSSGVKRPTQSSDCVLWRSDCDRPVTSLRVFACGFEMAAPFIGKESETRASGGRLARF